MAKAKDGRIALGASFDRHVDLDAPPPIDMICTANIKTLPQAVAARIGRIFPSVRRTSFRLASQDRAPIAVRLARVFI